MVDLDGARDGVRQNGGLVRTVAEQSGPRVELGGGIRSMEDLEEVFELGVWRAVLGSAAVEDPAFVREAVSRYGGRIAVGVDTKDGKVRTAGWVRDSGMDDLEFVKEMESIGVKTIIFTDIDTDGTLSGPSFTRLEALRRNYSGQIVASGGSPPMKTCVPSAAWGCMGPSLGRPGIPGRWIWPGPSGRRERSVSQADHTLPGCPERKGCKGS